MVNAFWLDRDLTQAVAWHVDAHVTSSLFECSMALTTAVQLNGYPEADALYYSHENHPLTRWTAESHGNWQYLESYVAALHDEWQYRWDHDVDDVHASWAVVQSLDREAVADLDWPGEGRTDPPQVTGDWRAPDYVDAYRSYYANEKRDLFSWAKDRTEPPWIEEYVADSPPA